MEQAGSENFPVASKVLPRRYVRHLSAVYDFARIVDDVGDEAPPSERSRLLDLLEDEVGRMYEGTARLPVTRALSATVKACDIPDEPFRQLIAANRRDQLVNRYETYDELLDYCTLSANPVGRIVLRIFDVSTPGRVVLSDSVCTALQLVEHLQDVAEDLVIRDRVYLPAEDLARFGCRVDDLRAPHAGERVRELIAFECARTGRLLGHGARLVGTLRGAARLAVSGYVAGGRASLGALDRADHDVLAGPPRAPRSRLVGHMVRTLILGR
jgi:squalene synthase HpnC